MVDMISTFFTLIGGLALVIVFLRVKVRFGGEIKIDAGLFGRRTKKPRVEE